MLRVLRKHLTYSVNDGMVEVAYNPDEKDETCVIVYIQTNGDKNEIGINWYELKELIEVLKDIDRDLISKFSDD